MVGPGHEHPLSGATNFAQMKKDHKNEPARIISQTDASKYTVSSQRTTVTLTHSAKLAGHHHHMGVISHDQSRPSSHPGANDHFKINPT